MNRSDNFNRADSSTSIGSPSDGGGAYTISPSSTWGIASNKAYKIAIDITHDIAYLEASSAIVDVQATVGTADVMGLIARVADNSNYILVQITATLLGLYKKVAGTFTQIGTNYTGSFSANDVIKLTINGANLISGYQNGTLRKSGTDAAGSANTKHGIYIYNVLSRWDDLTITDTTAASRPALIFFSRQAVNRAATY